MRMQVYSFPLVMYNHGMKLTSDQPRLNRGQVKKEEDVYTAHEKRYSFWAFEGVVDKRRIKVIVRIMEELNAGRRLMI